MRHINSWFNPNLFAFIAGILFGTVIYNAAGMEEALLLTDKIKGTDFWDSFFYLLMTNIRFLFLIFIFSFFKIRERLILLIIFAQSFLMAGFITLTILSGSLILIYEILIAGIKIICTIYMFKTKKPALSKIIALVILITGTLLENIFFVYF